MTAQTQPPSRWASNFATVCDAVGLLAWRLAQAAALIIAMWRLDVISPLLSLLS